MEDFYSDDDPIPRPTAEQLSRYQRENRLAICFLIAVTLGLLGTGIVMLVTR